MSTATRTVKCSAFGVDFCLAADSDELLERMQSRVPWGTAVGVEWRDAAGEFALLMEDARHRVTLDGKTFAEPDGLEAVLAELARGLMMHVAECAPDWIFVHAGVVAWGGRALVMPGASFVGKTTLVAELVRAGATYYSDEYAVLDAEGSVYPYARALAMRRDDSELRTPLTAEELGGRSGSGPLRVSHVVFAEYARGGVWKAEPVSAGMAALEMLRHAVPVQRTPGRVMAALAGMMQGATALRSSRGEAREAAQALLAMISAGEVDA